MADFVPLVIAETGATMRVGSRCRRRRAASRFAYYAEAGTSVARPAVAADPDARDAARARRAHRVVVHRAAGRRRRVHHLVQLPDHEHGRQARPRARRRATPSSSSPPRRTRCAASRCCAICRRRSASRRASSTSSPARAPRPARRSSSSPDVDMVSFTGSHRGRVAHRPRSRGRTMKRCLMELGGKGARDRLRRRRREEGRRRRWRACGASTPARSAPRRRGRSCTVEGLRRGGGRSHGGRRAPEGRRPARQGDTIVGPVITGAHRDRVEAMVAAGVSTTGAELLVGGERPDIDTGLLRRARRCSPTRQRR